MKHMLSSALIAGFAAGLIFALLQFVFLQPDIVLAEQYESGALTHFSGVGPNGAADDHAHDAGTEGIAHDHPAGPEISALQRQGLTVLFSVLTYCGYGLVLMAAIQGAEQLGVKIGPAQGLLWGLAGFMSFQMMPALGLAPELPGTPGPDLAARQIWWAATAIATAVGLWFMAYGGPIWQRVAGAGVLAAPHIWGAPQATVFGGVAPPELASAFTAHSLGVGMITWAVLGGLIVTFWRSTTAK